MKWLLVSLVCLGCAACDKTPEPTPEPATEAPKPAASTASKSPATEVAWDAPPSWQSQPNPTAMRKATYKIDDAEMSVSAAGGGVDANIKRWAGQFGDAKATTEKKKVNGLDVTVVEIKGAYSGMGGGDAKAGYMLLGAVVDLGQTQEFFKLIGPEKTVSASRPDFEKLVASFRPKQ